MTTFQVVDSLSSWIFGGLLASTLVLGQPIVKSAIVGRTAALIRDEGITGLEIQAETIRSVDLPSGLGADRHPYLCDRPRAVDGDVTRQLHLGSPKPVSFRTRRPAGLLDQVRWPVGTP